MFKTATALPFGSRLNEGLSFDERGLLFRMPAMRLDPDSLLEAYSQGAFPMADRDGSIHWYSSDPRGVLPLDQFHVPQTLGQLIRQKRFEIRVNFNFEAAMRGCMATRVQNTWINEKLIAAFLRLHELGHAHCVEAWHNNRLAGGLYGVSLGAAFFGESMFHHQRDASKVALAALVDRLRERGYELLDTQTCTAHLRRFGVIEIPEEDYLARLAKALKRECRFD
jgi:leucyl/phenylalanyl-tRNA--protein transferase